MAILTGCQFFNRQIDAEMVPIRYDSYQVPFDIAKMNLVRVNKTFLCILLGFGLILATPECLAENSSSGSVFDMPLDKAYANDFFQFFRLRVVGVSVTDDGFMEIIFKPPKREPSRTSVKLHVVLKKDGEIKRMQLILGRQFIDDVKQGMFARDFAKSFIQAGVHKEDYARVRPVVNEIFFRQKLTPIILGKGKSQGTISIFKLGEGKLASRS